MNQDLQKERRKSLHIKENKFGTFESFSRPTPSTNLFDCLAIFREKVKPYPKFKDVSAFQEWSYEELTPVRILKDKIEKEAKATRNQVVKLLTQASQHGVKSLDFRVSVVPAKGKRQTFHFKGSPNNILSDDGVMIEDVFTNCDTYSFLQDHSDARKELNENGSSVLFGGDESFPGHTKSARETRSVEEEEEEEEETKNRTCAT